MQEMKRDKTWVDVLLEIPWNDIIQYRGQGYVSIPPLRGQGHVSIPLSGRGYNSVKITSRMIRLDHDDFSMSFYNLHITTELIACETLLIYPTNNNPDISMSNIRLNFIKKTCRYDKIFIHMFVKAFPTVGVIYGDGSNLIEFSEMQDYTPIRVDFFKNPIDKINYIMMRS